MWPKKTPAECRRGRRSDSFTATDRRPIFAFSVSCWRFNGSAGGLRSMVVFFCRLGDALGLSASVCGFGHPLRVLGGTLPIKRQSVVCRNHRDSGKVDFLRDGVGLGRRLGPHARARRRHDIRNRPVRSRIVALAAAGHVELRPRRNQIAKYSDCRWRPVGPHDRRGAAQRSSSPRNRLRLSG